MLTKRIKSKKIVRAANLQCGNFFYSFFFTYRTCVRIIEIEVRSLNNKKISIEKYDLTYIFVDKKVFIKDERGDLSKEIIHYIDPTRNKSFYSKYAAEFFEINMRNLGRYRLDGVPFGCQPVIVYIEEIEEDE